MITGSIVLKKKMKKKKSVITWRNKKLKFDLGHLIPSIHPGNGSFRRLVMMLGRTMTTGRSPLRCPSTISPIALVKTYVFGHPNCLALDSCVANVSGSWCY
jgi:hypothetical protein